MSEIITRLSMKQINKDKKKDLLEDNSNPAILVVRFSSMGDILLTTPLLRALKARWPNSRVSFLTKEEFAPLLYGNPNVDELVLFPKGSGFSGLLKLARSLSRRHWDLLADLHGSLRSRLVRLLVPASLKYVYSKSLFKRILLIYCRFDLYGSGPPTLTERYADGLRRFGVELDSGPAELFLGEGEKAVVQKEISGRWPGETPPVLAVAPGAAWSTKRWPAERFAEAARKLASRYGLKAIILGSRKDSGPCGVVRASLGEKNCLDLSGRLSLLESAAAVTSSRLLLTNDTGLMHVATAVGTPVVAVFGPTTIHLGYFPYRAVSRVVETKLYCRPCTHNGRRRCPLGHFRCMRDIPVERVVEAAEGLLTLNR